MAFVHNASLTFAFAVTVPYLPYQIRGCCCCCCCQVILQTKVSLRCVRFLDSHRLLVGVRSRSTHAGVTTYIRAARAQLLLYAYDDRKHVGISSHRAKEMNGGRANPGNGGSAGGTAGPGAASAAVGESHGGGSEGAAGANGGASGGSSDGGSGNDGGPLLSNPVVVVRRALLYNDAGLDVTQDGATVLTCAEFWQLPQGGGMVGGHGAGGLGYAPPVSPLAPHDFVGGGDADAGDAAADYEDAQFESEGAERVAHLIQVSLALPRPQASSLSSSSSSSSSSSLLSPSSSPSSAHMGTVPMDTEEDLVAPSMNPFALPATTVAGGAGAETAAEAGSSSSKSVLQGGKGQVPLPAVTPHAHALPPPPFPPRATDAAAASYSTSSSSYPSASSSSSSAAAAAAAKRSFSSSFSSSSSSSLLSPSAGQLVRSASLEGLWAGAQAAASSAAQGGTFVTSVKLSPTGEYVLLGCSRGNTDATSPLYGSGGHGDGNGGPWQHPVAAVWRLGDMRRMGTLTSRTNHLEEDDANVALFHPLPGAGVVYGTKQGQIACALSPVVLHQAGLLRRAASRQSPLRGPTSPTENSP